MLDLVSIVFALLTSFFGVKTYAFYDISSQDLSWTQEKPWKSLLHYKPRAFLPGEASTVDGGDFFFAENGNVDPQAEAIAFSKALQENKVVGKLKQPVFCGFPERTRFLLEKTKIQLPDEIRNQECKYYKTYLNQFSDPQKISLVFSSAYPNNPASMFGHTLLKVHSKRKSDLLDVGLNYAAVVSDDENPFAFFWFGVSGGYEGRWSIEPYYVKVQDYINFESRDLWEYEINLTLEEVKRLIDHVWEIEANSFSGYYFFDENCSYQILSTIEAIKPNWDLLSDYNIYVIPGESVKFLANEPNSIRAVNYRPSLFRKAMAHYELIPVSERPLYNEVLRQKSEKELSQLSVPALDTLLIELDFKRNQDKKFANSWIDFEKAVRIERASRGVVKSPIDLSESATPSHRLTRPDIGNDSYSLQPTIGYKKAKLDGSEVEEEKSYTSIKIKSAYHDLLNSDAGYSQFSEIDFPWIQVGIDNKNKIRIDELGGLQTISLSPVSHFKTPISFKAKIAIENFEYFGSQFYYVLGGVGFGLTTNLQDQDQRLYGLVTLDSELAPEFYSGYRLLPGFEIGYLKDFSNVYKLQFLSKIKCNVVKSSECRVESDIEINQSFLFKRNHEFRNMNSMRQIFFEQKIFELNFSASYIYFFN